jgi:PAS domain S-box-containing protein
MTATRLPDAVLASIVQIASDAILCVDEAQRIVFFNDGAVRMFGYTAAEAQGKSLSSMMPERFRKVHATHVRGFGEGHVTARAMAERSTIYALRKSGDEFVAQAAIARVLTDAGTIFAVVLRDVSEQRRNEAVVQQALQRAEAAVRDRDDMLSLVSHDLRNPVNAVRMLASALLRIPTSDDARALPAAAAEHASVMLQASTQMDALIQDLLDVTRLERGQLRLVRRPSAIGALLTASADVLAPMAEGKNILLETEVEAGLPAVDVDPDRIAQVLSNLIGNALKFTREGGEVRLRGVRHADGVEVRVQDTGVGITADDLPFVFDRFWQSRRTDRSGAGLGLAIAKGIIEAHGGTIAMESAIGRGTLIAFTLPRAK